ncbi:MAG: Rv3212 family protein [Pseudonocardiaceae bacterium]
MPAPERRTWGDLTAAAVLAVAVLVVAGTLWWTSDIRHTTSITATGPAPAEQAPDAVRLPSALRELWRAASPAAPVPLAKDGIAVTAAGGEVAGRDIGSGAIRWSYQRDLPLCTVGAAFDRVVALYQRGETCSETTTLQWADGRRGAQRTGPVEAPTRLAGDSDQAATTGRRYLEVWRSDLVRTLAYGRLPSPAEPATEPRPNCIHGSLALSSERLAVVEHCPDERSARLTVQRSRPKEPEQPEVDFSTLVPGAQARVVALSTDRVAVAVPGPPRLLVYDARGDVVGTYPLAVPDTDLRGDPPGGQVAITRTPTGFYWFTGSATVALDVDDLQPRWTHPGSLGPGSMFAGRLLLPVPGALRVLDPITGQELQTLPVNRGGYRGPVGTATDGSVVLEQRGGTLVALG